MQPTEDGISAYTVKDFCRAFGIGRSLAYAEMAALRLRTRKAGRRTLILKVDAEAWLNSLPDGRPTVGRSGSNESGGQIV